MEDHEIVDLYWERSETAVAETSKKYGRYCKTIAFRIVGSDEDAEECVNDTYLGAWKAMPTQRPSRLQVFLGKITRNLALNKYDYNTAGKRDQGLGVILSELGDCVSGRESVEADFDEGETARQISLFLRAETADSHTAFLRRYWYAEPVAAIAGSLGMSESKVKSMLFRARGRLRDHLQKEGIPL